MYSASIFLHLFSFCGASVRIQVVASLFTKLRDKTHSQHK